MSQKIKHINLVVHPGFLLYKRLLNARKTSNRSSEEGLDRKEKEFLRRHFNIYGQAILNAVKDPKSVTIVVFHPQLYYDAQLITERLKGGLRELAEYEKRFIAFVKKQATESKRIAVIIKGPTEGGLIPSTEMEYAFRQLYEQKQEFDEKEVSIRAFGEYKEICVKDYVTETKQYLLLQNSKRKIKEEPVHRFGAVSFGTMIESNKQLRRKALRRRRQLKRVQKHLK